MVLNCNTETLDSSAVVFRFTVAMITRSVQFSNKDPEGSVAPVIATVEYFS